MEKEERKRFARLNADWRAGKKIDQLLFHYNTIVSVTMPDGKTIKGWVVGATIDGSEPIYTVETTSGSGDLQCPESTLTVTD